MKIGIAYDLKSSVQVQQGSPEDATEEYDPPETIAKIVTEIERCGHTVVHLGGGNEFLEKIHTHKVDFIFNIAEGRGTFRSREAQIPSILEMVGIPYAGSDPLTLALCLDKPLAKLVASAKGVTTPKYYTVKDSFDYTLHPNTMGFPVVVKPSFEGSSKGIRCTSCVADANKLQQTVDDMLKMYRQPVLVEEFIPGTEITVGVIGNNPPKVIGILEVVPKQNIENFMYTLEVKRDFQNLVSFRCPPKLPQSCLEQIQSIALELFEIFGCRDMARIDFRIDKNFTPYFIEANPLPGLSPVYSDLCILASLCNYSYDRLISEILNSALQRYSR